jgi:hypothetical protein
VSLFSSDPFSTLRSDTLFASDYQTKRFNACPPTWQATAHIDPHGHLGHSSVLDNPLPVSCAGGYENAVRVMVQHLSQYVRYDTEMTPDVNGFTRFCEACNGVPEGGDASDYALPDSLDYYARFADGSRDNDDNITSCRSDEPYAKLRWVDYPSAGYMCQATIRDYLNYSIKQRFSEEDYEAACADCTLGDIIEELLGGDDDDDDNWWDDYDPDAPVDCETSEWSKWGECIEGRQKRTKKVLKFNKNGGAECDEQRAAEKVNGVWSIVEIRNCTDCEITGWSAWSNCVAGKQSRTKKDMGETATEEKGCMLLEEERNCTVDSSGSGNTTEDSIPMWLILAAVGAVGLNFIA